MLNFAELPPSIAIFPLRGALLLPRSRLPLHIFEPRYLALLDDALKTQHRLVGMIQPRAGHGDEVHRLHSVGCAGRVTAFSETEDGRYMITLAGVSRFRVESVQAGFEPYLKCDAGWDAFSHDLGPVEPGGTFNRDGFFDLLGRYFESQSLSTDWESLREAEDELLINSLSMLCPFEPEEKQALLETPSLSLRRETLITLFEFALRGGRTDEQLQ